jgi:hypothetical protein
MTSTVLRLLIAAVGIMETRLLLRTVGFARTISLMTVLPALGRQAVPDPRWVPEIAWAARRLGGSCLDRSVLLWFVLEQHGMDGSIRIGVARDGDTIDGHAWVELNGVVLNDSPDIGERFAVFHEDPVALVFR